MKYYSDLTEEKYETVEELEAAEAAYNEEHSGEKTVEAEQKMTEAEKAQAKAEALAEKKRKERAAAAKKIEEILEAIKYTQRDINDLKRELRKQQRDYEEALSEFCRKYGAYHTTIREPVSTVFDLFWDF